MEYQTTLGQSIMLNEVREEVTAKTELEILKRHRVNFRIIL